MTSICRLCLAQNVEMFPLFSQDDLHCQSITLATQVSMCTSLEIASSDKLPQQICQKCMNFIREWLAFRQRSIESEAKLKVDVEKSQEAKIRSKSDPPATGRNSAKRKRASRIRADSTPECSEDAPLKKNSRSCCSRTFLTKISYRLHMKECHTNVDLFCDECGKKGFSSKVTLRRHKLLHSKRHQCSFCPKAFTCKALMRVHERAVHENDLPFVCDICGKAFVTELCLTYHQRFHYDERNYMCEVCGVPFVTSSGLYKHKATHSNVRPHVCEMCGKGFIVPMRLVEHMRLHTGERPYACNLCDKSYASSCKLKRHKKSHNVTS